LDVFFNSVGDQMRQIEQTAPSTNSWSMALLKGVAASAPAATRNRDDRLETFHIGKDKDSSLFNDWQTAPNSGWSGPRFCELNQLKGSPCAVRNIDGRLEVFALDKDNNMRNAWQENPAAGPWAHGSLGGGALPNGSSLAELGVRMGWFFAE